MLQQTRKLLRLVIAASLYYSGLLWLYATIKLHRSVVVLMYHRVLPTDADSFSDDSIVVTPDRFARHLGFLKRHFRLLSVSQLEELLRSGVPLPSRGCVITFDDGWEDNITHALPVLCTQQVPATVFLATDYIGSNTCFWQERLARRMFLALDQSDGTRSLVERRMVTGVHQLDAAQRKKAIRRAIGDMKQLQPDQIKCFESALEEALAAAGATSVSSGDDRFMTWEQVARLIPPSPLTTAAHGCSHVPLTTVSATVAAAELLGSRKRIEAAVGEQVSAFAYPNGDYDEAVAQIARHAGYAIAFTTQRGLVRAGDDPLKLRRLNVHENAAGTLPELLCLILGVFHKWPRKV